MDKGKDINKEVEQARKQAIWDNAPVTTFNELDDVLHKWLEIVDWGLTKVIVAFVVANQLPGNSVWALLVGSSGSGKALLPDHEVLTDKGWKFIGDIKVGDQVMAWDQEVEHSDGQLKYATVQGVYEQNHDGPIYVSNDSRPFFKASPDHRWLVNWSRNRSPKKNRWKVIRSTDLSNGMCIPASGNPLRIGKQDYSDEEMELIGWYIAEGCKGQRPGMSRFSQYKKAGITRMVELLTKLGIEHHVYHGEIEAQWLPPFECGNNCYEKFIPRELLSQKNRDKLLHGLIQGDGSYVRKGWEYYTASDQLRDDVQELAFGLGWRVNYSLKKVNYKYRSNNHIKKTKNGKGMDLQYLVKNWRIGAFKYKQIHLGKIKTEHYKGKTHCLWVPGPGTFIARYNGTPFVTGNTEMISGLNYIPFIFSLSSLTPQTLISGQRGVQGLLWELSGKTLTIKDLTTILEMNSDARAEIFAQFREMYDGSFEKSYGTGETKKWSGKVGLFAGVTSVIDVREQAYSALGERFIKYRIIPPNRRVIARKALENTTKTNKMQEEIKEFFARCVKTTMDLVKKDEDLILTEVQIEQLIRLADFATLARSPVTRDYGMSKEVIYKPSSEMPTRFTQQLSQVAIALKLINRANGLKDELLEIDNKILFKIALDSIPQMRRQMLQKLAENIEITTEQAAESTSYPTNTARRYLEDLFVLGLCERKRNEGQSHVWILKDEYRDIMAEYDGVKMLSEEERMMQAAEVLAVRDIFEDEMPTESEDLPDNLNL